MQVPGDISLTGFGDTAVRLGRSQMLTSLAVDSALMGRRAAELVTGEPDAAPVPVLVSPELVVRGTTAPPRQT